MEFAYILIAAVLLLPLLAPRRWFGLCAGVLLVAVLGAFLAQRAVGGDTWGDFLVRMLAGAMLTAAVVGILARVAILAARRAPGAPDLRIVPALAGASAVMLAVMLANG